MFGLTTPLSRISSISPRFSKALERLGLKTVKDLIWHFPSRYEDFSEVYKIADLEPGQQATISGIVKEANLRRSFRKRMVIVEAKIEDETGRIRAVWFNQPYLKTVLRPGRRMNFSGKVSFSEGEIYLSHPDYESVTSGMRHETSEAIDTRHTGRLVPIYPETKGLTSRAIRFILQPILRDLEKIEEFLPLEILKNEDIPEINAAIQKIHFPDAIEEVEKVKRRFAFQDLFLLQIFNIQQKLKLAEEKSPEIKNDIPYVKKILDTLPFVLTNSQKKSLWEVMKDLEKGQPMNRLLQGDVGSGKTVVAAIAALLTARNELQAAFMAPTEVLASQHFKTMKKLFKGIKGGLEEGLPPIGILTSSGAKIFFADELETELKKPQAQKKIKNGEIKIIIGTHALIQKSVGFKNLGLVIVDEQHRFGVKQRALLVRGQDADNTRTTKNELLFKDITYKIRTCFFNIKEIIGLGHKEVIYQNALVEEFKNAGLKFNREVIINIEYNGKKIGVYRPDFVVEEKVIVEIKALPFVGTIEERQIWNYLKGSNYKLAILVNFSPKEVQIKRVVYDTARDSVKSASSPRMSVFSPHLLSMSATPIPRTLMLTIFGDLDISIIDEMPKGRKEIITKVVSGENRGRAYDFIRNEVQKGRQAFVICPRIDIPQINADGFPRFNSGQARTDADNTQTNTGEGKTPRGSAFGQRESALWEVKSVKEEHEKLSKKTFPELKVGMIHGQLKAKEKEKVMNDFRDGKIQVLVSTSVIEVGVDIPNATIMMIEGAERFGLAQLYQFRGRVGRGEHQSYCFLFSGTESDSSKNRLEQLVRAKSGFELAEKDLRMRGPGEFLGQSQTGLPDIAMEALQNPELIKSAREAAAETLKKDPALKKSPKIKEALDQFQRKIHQE